MKSFEEVKPGDIFYHVDNSLEIIDYEFIRIDKFFKDDGIFMKHFIGKTIKTIRFEIFKKEYFKTRKTARKYLKIELEKKLKEYESFRNNNIIFTHFENIKEDKFYYMVDVETFSIIRIFILKKFPFANCNELYYAHASGCSFEHGEKGKCFPTIFEKEKDAKALIYQWLLETKENYGF